MALGDRKIPEVFNKKTGGSADARSITSEKELEIKAEYDAGVHVADDGMFNTIAPALYAIQKLSEDIDELRRYITAEITSITSTQASAITANTAKRTSPSWVPSSNPNYLTSSSTQSKYLRSDAVDYFTGKLNWDGADYADGINMSLGNINDAGFMKANEFRQRLSGRPRNNLGDPTVTEMALFEEQFGPKTTLANDYDDLTDLTFWSQETSSSDWVEVTSYSDDQKRKFLRTNNSTVVIPNTYYKFRVEFKARSYTFANAVYMYWSSQSHNSQVHVWKKRCSDGTWLQHTSATNTISSWPGHGWIPFSNIPWHETNTTSTGHFTHIRVEFTPNWSGHATYGDRPIAIYGMQIWGGYPKGRKTPHYYDQNGEFNFLKDAHLQDGKKLKFGASADLQIYHDGSNSYIDENGTGDLILKSNSAAIRMQHHSEMMLKGIANGAVELYHNNSKKLETTSSGVKITGTIGNLGSGVGQQLEYGSSAVTTLRFDADRWRLYAGGTGSEVFGVTEAGNVTVSGTVDGRDIATDGTKLDTIATNADVTPSWVPSSDPGYGTSNLALGTTSTTALAGDTVTITTAQAAILTNLANLPTRAGARGTFWNDRGVLKVS